MSYSCRHETSNFCSPAFGRGAREARSGAALQRRLRDAPVPDPSGERPRGIPFEDSLKPRVRLADGSQRHTCLRPEGSCSSHARFLAAQARACRLRPTKRRSLAGDAAPLPEGVRALLEPVDLRDGRRCRLRGGTDRGPSLGGDDPGYALASAFGEVDASPRRWITSPDPLYERKKGGATD